MRKSRDRQGSGLRHEPGRLLNQAALLIPFVVLVGLLQGCISNKLYNPLPEQYVLELTQPTDETVGIDIAVIEFDEFGMLWAPDQLQAALDLIHERNAASERGIIVVTYTHGWMNNANPDREDNDLTQFQTGMRSLGSELRAEGAPAPDHVVGIYLGWRGATNRIPLLSTLSFWNRKDAAERVASYQMRETLFRVTATAKMRPDSKVLLSGHSMGGMILARTLAPMLSTLLLASGPDGVRAPADMVVLQNPALDGLAAFQLIEYLKRTGARLEHRHSDGRVEPAQGPVIASITSEADWVTGLAYPAGQIVDNLTRSFRDDLGAQIPSQGKLANRAHGHMDFLVSHRARMHEGRVVIEPVPGAYNDTPFWIIQTTKEICRDHGDIYNERFLKLVEQVTKLNRLYETDLQTWIAQTHPLTTLHAGPRTEP
ncbi:MAG: hypothetical protein ACFCBV_11200 [Phycisphaerales bacterium]